MYCEIHTMTDIRRKVGAFRELFQREPLIRLKGTWEDEEGDAVFFDSHPSQLVRIEKKFVQVDVDGEWTELRPTLFSGMNLE